MRINRKRELIINLEKKKTGGATDRHDNKTTPT